MKPTLAIEDLALIGDLHTAALISRAGTIEWLCLPQFDSGACFASLLGDRDNGCWELAPADAVTHAERSYRGETLVLETTMRTRGGSVRIVDFMPRRARHPVVVRLVEGLSGCVEMRTRVSFRFEYGSLPPWTRRMPDDAITFTVGRDGAVLRSSIQMEVERPDACAAFRVQAGERVRFVLQWYRSYEDPPEAPDADEALLETERLWNEWTDACTYRGPYREAVIRSLVTLKALTYEPSGGCIAAATTSLPERIGGSANWDYRYAWVRDSALTIDALVPAGYVEEARAWRDWLLRALAGAPERLQIMYTATGHGRISEYEIPWLSGYARSSPVRVGNAAFEQFQLGIYGQLMQAIVAAHDAGIEIDEQAWAMLVRLLDYVRDHWHDADSGIWEYRGRLKRYTQSRMMAWAAFDRAIHAAQTLRYQSPLAQWEKTRRRIHEDVCRHGFDRKLNAFVQAYGSKELDASVLTMPLIGFLPAGDPRVLGTIDAIERTLCVDGFVMRATRHVRIKRLREGSFLACDCWLAHAYALTGRVDDARRLFERVLAVRNDVGLLSEEYDVERRRLVGNFPQTFSHATLVNAALAIGAASGDGTPSLAAATQS